MRFAASSNEMFHLLLFAIGSNEFVLVAHDLVSGAVTANRHSHGDCQHPACIMLLGYHWTDVLPPAAKKKGPVAFELTSCAFVSERRPAGDEIRICAVSQCDERTDAIWCDSVAKWRLCWRRRR